MSIFAGRGVAGERPGATRLNHSYHRYARKNVVQMRTRYLMMKVRNTLFTILCSLLFSAAAHAVEVGEQAPSFTLPKLNAELPASAVNLADFRGKVIYLDFWASWCAPCHISIPLLNKLRNEYAEQGLPFEVIAINVDSNPEDGMDFLRDVPVEYVVLSDPEGNTPSQYGLKAMPTAYLVDQTGTVRLVHSGFKRSDIDMIADRVQNLLEDTMKAGSHE